MSEERLAAEVQIAPSPRVNGTVLKAMEIAQDELDAVLEQTSLSPDVQALIQRMMDGSEAYGRDLKVNEVQKFNAMHVNIATLRAAGFKGREIIQITGCGRQHVYFTLIHPYTKKLIAALVPQNSARVIDIRTRLDEFAGELLDKTFGLALVSEDLGKVSSVTFGLLDRAGYAPLSNKAPAERDPRDVTRDDSVMKRLLSAMEGSAQIDKEIMPGWLPPRPPDEGITGAEGASVDADLDATPGFGGSDAGSQRAVGGT